jgi:hypothetical protein
VVKVKKRSMAANMTDDLLNDYMDFMLSLVAENISFFFIEIENFIKNETRVREAEGIFKIEVPDTGTWGHDLHYPPFFSNFFHTLLNIILVSNNHKSTISFS